MDEHDLGKEDGHVAETELIPQAHELPSSLSIMHLYVSSSR